MLRFEIFGCKISVSIFFTAVITFMLLTDSTGIVTFMLISVMCHEAGHLTAMKLCSVKMGEIKLLPFSVDISVGNKGTPGKRLFITSAGIISNVLCFLSGILFYSIFGGERTVFFCFSQCLIGLYNFLPVKGLDGNEILYCLLCFSSLTENAVNRICRAVSYIFILIIGIVAVFLFFKMHNPFLILFCIYLFILG